VHYDAIIVGLGGLGSAALYHTAKAGLRVLGIDRFTPPHDRGSSHGETRIYRQAYYEDPAYVPLSVRSLGLWRDLERESRTTLFANTGGLTIGPAHGELYGGALRSAQQHGIAHEVLAWEESLRRFPAFAPLPDASVLFEPTAGVLFVEKCITAHLGLARAHGAGILFGSAVTRVDQRDSSVVVHTERGAYEARRAVVSAGAWMPDLLEMTASFRVTREMVHWFEPESVSLSAANGCPVSMIEFQEGPILYTLPHFEQGFKAGLHHSGAIAWPDDPLSGLDDNSAAVMSAMERCIPAAATAIRASKPCYYTTTPDHHFAIGLLAHAPDVILHSACSGHGFKFASALGEAVARMARGAASGLPGEIVDVTRLAIGNRQ
jgi:sarcosine oxidase